jgi:HSP20 family protein
MVTRWDPFGGALSLRDAMDRLFEQSIWRPAAETGRPADGGAWAPALDVQETSDGYTIKASLPGVKPEGVNIQYQRGMLTISGSTSDEQTREQVGYHIRERRSGRFSRSLSLPDVVDADHAAATFEHGVLELRMPRAEASKPRRIEVHAGAPAGGELKAGSENGARAAAAATA